MRRKHFPQSGTDLAAAPDMAMSVTMVVSVASAVVVSVACGVWAGVVGHQRRPFARAGVGSALAMSGMMSISPRSSAALAVELSGMIMKRTSSTSGRLPPV